MEGVKDSRSLQSPGARSEALAVVGELHLQQELAKSSSELDAVRTAWASFGQSLQRQLQGFLSLDASQVGSGVLKARQLVQGLAELQRDEESSDFLRSLEESQRRCESVNREMVRQVQKHEELVRALAALKDTNRRLVEQIRIQSDEIETISQQKATDEQRLLLANSRHDQDFSSSRLEASRQMAAARDIALRRKERTREQMQEALRQWSAHAQMQFQAVAAISDEQSQLRRELTAFQADVKVLVGSGLDRLLSHGHFQKAAKSKQDAKETVESLTTEIRVEKEQRTQESLNFSYEQDRYMSRTAQLQASLARDLSSLASQLQAWERKKAADHQAWKEEEDQLLRQCEEASQKKQQKEEDTMRIQAKQEEMQKQMGLAEESLQDVRKEIQQLKSQFQQSDAALFAARSSTQHLNQQIVQMEEVLKRASKAEMDTLLQDAERHAGKLAQLRTLEAEAIRQHLQDLEMKVREEEQVLQSIDGEVGKEVQNCDGLTGEISQVRTQVDDLQDQRRSLEDRLADARREGLLEQTKMQVACDQISLDIADLEWQICRLEEKMEVLQRLAADAEVRVATRQSLGQNELRAAQEELQALKRRVSRTAELQSQVKAEANTGKQQTAAQELDLQKRLETVDAKKGEDLKALKLQLVHEEEAVKKAQKDLQQATGEGSEQLKRAQEQGRAKLRAAQEAKLTAEDTRRAELKLNSDALAAQQRHMQNLEQKTGTLRQRLLQNEQHLGWLHQQLQLEETKATTQMKVEVGALDSSIHKAMGEEATLTKQLEEVVRKKEEHPLLTGAFPGGTCGPGSSRAQLLQSRESLEAELVRECCRPCQLQFAAKQVGRSHCSLAAAHGRAAQQSGGRTAHTGGSLPMLMVLCLS